MSMVKSCRERQLHQWLVMRHCSGSASEMAGEVGSRVRQVDRCMQILRMAGHREKMENNRVLGFFKMSNCKTLGGMIAKPVDCSEEE